MIMMNNELSSRFKSHAMTEETKIKSQKIRSMVLTLADTIDIYCPDSRERSIAFTHLEECLFWCNACLSRNQ